MRKRARPYPKIVTKWWLQTNACYTTNNEILFQNMKNANEEDILLALLHEQEHWAQYMFLEDAEINDVLKQRASAMMKGVDYGMLFVERVNIWKPHLTEVFKYGASMPTAEFTKKWMHYWRLPKFTEEDA